MEDVKDKISDLASHVEDLAGTYYKLTVLNIAQRATNITSASITAIIVFISALFVLLFAGIALSLWLGNLLGNRAEGFLLGAGFYLIVMAIVMLVRKKLIFPFFRNMIIRKFYD